MTSPSRRFRDASDLLVGAAFLLGSLLAVYALPAGTPLRLFLVLPILFLVPGYLLMQLLVVPAAPAPARATHAIMSLGISPALVGLLALSTAFLPGGFRTGSIVGLVTLVGLGFAAGAGFRRWHVTPRSDERPQDAFEPGVSSPVDGSGALQDRSRPAASDVRLATPRHQAGPLEPSGEANPMQRPESSGDSVYVRARAASVDPPEREPQLVNR
jgi:hypothetical protein